MNSPRADDPRHTRYLTAADLVNLNVTVTDGDTFVRDFHLLDAEVRRPATVIFGVPQFPTLHDKAAALLHSVAYRHLFADGNKRTAQWAVALFLERNGWALTADEAALRAFVLAVARGDADTDAIARWLRAHSAPAGA